MPHRRFAPFILAVVAVAVLVAASRVATVGQAAPAADQTIYLPLIQQGCGPMQLVADGGFEAGLPTSAWQTQSNVGSLLIDDTDPPPTHSGTWKAWLGGDNDVQETLSQTLTIPDTSARLVVSYWWLVSTEEQTHPFDTLSVEIRDANNQALETLQTLTDGDARASYQQSVFILSSAYAGQTVRLAFVAQTDDSNTTSFFIDDVSVMKYCTVQP